MGILNRNQVRLGYEVDAAPALRCPISGKVIFRIDPAGEGKPIAYGRIKPVLFNLVSPMIGGDEDLDYLRKDLRQAIKALRKSLPRDDRDASLYDLLDGHFDDWPGNVLVFEITLDRMHGECQYIGIDMGAEDCDSDTED